MARPAGVYLHLLRFTGGALPLVGSRCDTEESLSPVFLPACTARAGCTAYVVELRAKRSRERSSNRVKRTGCPGKISSPLAGPCRKERPRGVRTPRGWRLTVHGGHPHATHPRDRVLRQWTCRESNPGPRRDSSSIYERSQCPLAGEANRLEISERWPSRPNHSLLALV
jgi:hypothetical protein